MNSTAGRVCKPFAMSCYSLEPFMPSSEAMYRSTAHEEAE